MKIELVRVGNSRGIRIPKPIIEQCGFDDTVDLQVIKGEVVISRGHVVREGWEAAFRAANTSGDELLLDGLAVNEFDRTEWEW